MKRLGTKTKKLVKQKNAIPNVDQYLLMMKAISHSKLMCCQFIVGMDGSMEKNHLMVRNPPVKVLHPPAKVAMDLMTWQMMCRSD